MTRRTNKKQKEANKSKKLTLNTFKLVTVFNGKWASDYGTIVENRPNKGTVKSLKDGFEPEILN